MNNTTSMLTLIPVNLTNHEKPDAMQPIAYLFLSGEVLSQKNLHCLIVICIVVTAIVAFLGWKRYIDHLDRERNTQHTFSCKSKLSWSEEMTQLGRYAHLKRSYSLPSLSVQQCKENQEVFHALNDDPGKYATS